MLQYISRLSNDNSNSEFVAIGVFVLFYIFARMIEYWIIPIIPGFFTGEIKSLFKWSPIIIPVIFGLHKKANETDDKTLKERMMIWSKK